MSPVFARSVALMGAILAALPLAAATPAPQARRDAYSMGVGLHRSGPMLTFMVTGERLGIFTGAATSLPTQKGEATVYAPGPESRLVREEDGRHQLHLGVAFRVDHRVVLGVGVAHQVTSYRTVLHRGSNPWSMPEDPGGDLTETRTGPLAMADLRLGAAWGVHLVAGTGGAGAALTLRF